MSTSTRAGSSNPGATSHAHRRTTSRFVALVTAAAIGLGSALVGVAAPAAAAPGDTFSITGHVTDQDSSPIAGALVHVVLAAPDANAPAPDPAAITVTTGPDGGYTLDGVTAGSIVDASVSLDVPAESRRYYSTQYWEDAESSDDATPLPQPSEDETQLTDIDFTLERSPAIAARLADADGNGIPNLIYTVYTLDDESDNAEPYSAGDSGRTDASGWFSLPVDAGSTSKLLFEDDLGRDLDNPGDVSRTQPFSTEYFDNAASLAAATPVTVSGASEQRNLGTIVVSPHTGPTVILGDPVTIVVDPNEVEDPDAAHTLGYESGIFSPASAHLTTQWLRDGTEIAGATAETYAYVDADYGSDITVRVTATRADGDVTEFLSAPYKLRREFTAAPDPTIDGTPAVGATLTALPGTWDPLPDFTFQWSKDGTAIADATASTYTLLATDLDAEITVAVTGTLQGYTPATRTSEPTSPVAPGEGTSAIPVISGTTTYGQTLTVDEGTWLPNTVEFTYQWMRNGSDILGATGKNYLLEADDVGAPISVRVTGTAPGYTPLTEVSASTAGVAKAKFAAQAPTVTGTLTFGETIHAVAGTWTPMPTALSYQWFRGTTPITGATSEKLVLTVDDVGETLSVQVTGSSEGYSSHTEVFVAPTVVSAAALAATPVPLISGNTTSPVFGKELFGYLPTAWSPAPVVVSYQWLRNGTAIAGATTATYELAEGDIGTKVSLRVRGAKPGYSPVTQTSTETGTVQAATLVVSHAPSISGAAVFGGTLTVTPPTWVVAPTDIDFQWMRDGAVIPGAEAATYTLAVADIATEVTVVVTGTRAGYLPKSVTAGATAEVVPALFTSTPTPTISGRAVRGVTLTANLGQWAPAADSLEVQWLWNGDLPIPGATTATYAASTDDLGKTLSVRVTARRTGYSVEQTLSSATAKVKTEEAFSKAPKPTITGTARVGSTLTAKAGTWSPTPANLGYTWKVSGKAVADATAPTFVPRASDRGKTITVVVTASGPGYITKSVASSATAKTKYGVIKPKTPKISGTIKVNETLTAVPGTWTPEGVKLTYKWLRSGKVISGAKSSTYKTTASDYKKKISVRVTGSRSGYTTVIKTSSSSKAVAAGVMTAPVPEITGTLVAGSTVTVAAGTWAPGTVKKTYRWYLNGVAISKATARTYKIPSSARGKQLSVKVTGTKTAFKSVSRASVRVAVAP